MKIAARRRTAVGVVATTTALLAGVLIAPASNAGAGDLRINPNTAVNTETVKALVFEGKDADFRIGGTATFTRQGGGVPFTVDIPRDATGSSAVRDPRGEATENFADQGANLGNDGPTDAGQYDVTATGADDPVVPQVGGGTDSCAFCFTVLSPGPVSVSSVAPNSLRPSAQGNISILGNNFERGSVVEVLLADGSVDPNVNANNAPTTDNTDAGTAQTEGITTRTELKRRVKLLAAAVPGARDVRVRNLDGNGTTTICAGCFFVAGPALTNVTPKNGDFNDPNQPLTTLTFNGPNVTNGVPRLEFAGTPGSASRSQLTVIGQDVRGYTGTAITADFDLRNAAPQGNGYQPQVVGSDGIVNACDCRFTVTQRIERAPTLTNLDRSDDAGTQKDLKQGETATFRATGTNFSRGATLVFPASDLLTVTSVEFVSPEQLLVTIAAATNSPAGDKDPQARLTDGQTSPICDNCLTVMSSTASPSPSATGSASPRPTSSATPNPSGDARYAGLASPTRVLDTRSNRGPRRTGEIVLDLSQRIADTSATAAVLNVTVTNPTARGFLVAYPNGSAKPGTSNVNFETNQTQANEVVVGLSSNRRVSLFVDSASAHVVVDLVGFFTTRSSTDTGRVTSNAPVRALDSRTTSTPRRTGEVILELAGRLPSGSTDAILNVTVQGPSARGFVVAYPTGTSRPGTSNVNFERGQTQANEVITRVGTGSNAGKVSLFIDSATTAIIVDVVGAVTPGTIAGSQVYTALQTPSRALDTRSNRGSRRTGNVDVAMPTSVPNNASGVILNVTATNGTRSGFVTVFPAGQSNPGTSNVNFPTNLTQANEVTTRLGSNRSVTLFVGGQDGVAAHLIVDVVGYLTETGAAPAPSGSGSPAASGSPRPSGSATPTCTPSLLQTCPSASPSPAASASPTASSTPAASASPAASVSPSPRPS